MDAKNRLINTDTLAFQPWALHKLTVEQLEQFDQLMLLVEPESEQGALPAPSPGDDEIATTASVPRDDWQEGQIDKEPDGSCWSNFANRPPTVPR